MNKNLLLIFVGALTLRLFLVFSAYHGDLNNNISWGTIAVERGLDGFYGSDKAEDWPYSAPNQPPLTILMFAATRYVWQIVEDTTWFLNDNFKIFPSPFIWFWEEQGVTLTVKLPGILADLGIGWMIYYYIIQKKRDKKLATILTSVWLFNPISWYSSAVWGQTDSIVNLLGIIAVFALLKKDLLRFAFVITLSILFKGSLLIFTPVLIIVSLWQKHSPEKWFKAFIYSTFTIFIVSIWFHPRLDFFAWLYGLYKTRILPGEIGYLTANAFNFWWLIDPGKVLDSTLYFGISARVWGFVITALVIGSLIVWLRKSISDKRVLVALAVSAVVSFLFMTRIHERYLYPFFPYATVLIGFIPTFVLPYAIFSFTQMLNMYHLFWAPPASWLESLYAYPIFAQTISLINIVTFFYLLRHFRSSKI